MTDPGLWLASVTTYWDLLREYPPDDIRAAFRLAWKRHPEWFPSAGQLASLIEGRAKDAAEEAWPEVLRLASRSSADHPDPVAAEALKRMGGGAALGQMRSDDLVVWGKKAFLEHYQDIAKAKQAVAAKAAVQAAQLGPGTSTALAKGNGSAQP